MGRTNDATEFSLLILDEQNQVATIDLDKAKIAKEEVLIDNLGSIQHLRDDCDFVIDDLEYAQYIQILLKHHIGDHEIYDDVYEGRWSVMGVDQSITCTGIWVREFVGVVPVAHHMFRLLSEPEEHHGTDLDNFTKIDRMLWTRDQILDLIEKYNTRHVTIEGLSMGSVSSSTRDLASLFGLIAGAIRELDGVELRKITPTSLKKLFTGKGNAKKPDMFNAVSEKYNQYVVDGLMTLPKTKGRYDICDAIALCEHGFDARSLLVKFAGLIDLMNADQESHFVEYVYEVNAQFEALEIVERACVVVDKPVSISTIKR